jgi:hypothetical protein
MRRAEGREEGCSVVGVPMVCCRKAEWKKVERDTKR